MTLRQMRNYIIVFGVVVLGLVFVLIYATTTLNNTMSIMIDLTSLQEVVQAVGHIEGAMEEERIAIGQYPLTGSSDLLDRIDAAQALYDENWAVVVANRGETMATQLADIEAARATYQGLLQEVIDEYQSNPTNNQASSRLSTAINYYLQNLDPKFSSLADPEVKKLSEQVEIEKVRAVTLKRQSQGATVLGILASVAAVFMTGLAVFGTQRMVGAINSIVKAANSISRGDLDVAINVEQRGEIGEMAGAIERMRTSLKAAIERLRR
jgi:HAMP domain-containing protein